MLSNRGKYATRALLELALEEGNRPVSIQEIASRQNIPLKFLEQILLALKHAGFVESRKGPGGGYMLAKPASQVKLGAVVRAIDGPLALVSCVSVTQFGECGCPCPDACGLRDAWQEARDALSGVLDGTSFADIRERHLRLDTSQAFVHDFSI